MNIIAEDKIGESIILITEKNKDHFITFILHEDEDEDFGEVIVKYGKHTQGDTLMIEGYKEEAEEGHKNVLEFIKKYGPLPLLYWSEENESYYGKSEGSKNRVKEIESENFYKTGKWATLDELEAFNKKVALGEIE